MFCCSPQCDTWRPLRLPAILVGDGRLGGISTTLAAADVLRMRGYDIAAVLLLEGSLANSAAVRQNLPCASPPLSCLHPHNAKPRNGRALRCVRWWLRDSGV